MWTRKLKAPPDRVDVEANRVANRVARDRKRLVRRRQWAVETAMMCNDELTAKERIELAREIDAYVHGEDEGGPQGSRQGALGEI